MLRIRHFEQRASQVFAAGKLPGVIHTYVGMEAVAVGACAVLRRDDYVTSTHRGHGHCIAKSGDVRPVMAELYGKKTGYCSGKGGSMHIASTEHGILGANGIVAAGMSIAAGAALASVYESGDRVAISFFGDGAVNRGPFHETLNLASVWSLPVIFIAENNQYGVSTSIRDTLACDSIAARAASYRMPGVTVDGNDVFAVHAAVNAAVARARAGDGPTLIEADTYRLRGHFEGDPQGYKSQPERDTWATKDPIVRARARLIDRGLLDPAGYDALDRKILDEIEGAVRFAESSPDPSPDAALEGVYS